MVMVPGSQILRRVWVFNKDGRRRLFVRMVDLLFLEIGTSWEDL